VIEVDGEIHTIKEIQNHDEGRTGELERLGIKVLRFTNSQVLQESDLVVEKIKAIIQELTKKNLNDEKKPFLPLSPRERGIEGVRQESQKISFIMEI
jgi:hypothetical protein